MDGGLAMCLLVTLGFGTFVIWGRTAAGRQVLRQTVGEPASVPRQSTHKANAPARRPKPVGKPAIASARPASSKKPSENVVTPRTKVTQPKKSGSVKEQSRSAKK